MYLIKEYNSFKNEIHKLSGIVLLVDDKVCVVLPKKFKRLNKYSIPKGHIEKGYSSYYNAYLELKEETGIDLGLKQFDSQFHYTYKKNGVNKKMDVFVISMTSDEFSKLKIGQRDKKEIKKVKFVNKSEALKLVENRFKKLIRYIYK